MEKVIMNVARTDTGYCCDCDLLPGWVVAHGGDFDEFKKYVQESIDFYIDCARKDGDAYPAVFDGQYEVVYKFDVASLLEYYRGISLSPPCRPLRASTRSSSATTHQASASHGPSRQRRLRTGFIALQRIY